MMKTQTPVALPAACSSLFACRRRPIRSGHVSRSLRLVKCSSDTGSYSARDNDENPPQLSGDWRAFRARLVALERSEAAATARKSAAAAAEAASEAQSPEGAAEAEAAKPRWAHQLSRPEKGCLLVARRGDMRFFNHTVVLLMYHEEDGGSAGVVLNNPSSRLVRDYPGASETASAFGQHTLFVGGPVEGNQLLALHTHARCSANNEIINGVYATEAKQLQELMAADVPPPQTGAAADAAVPIKVLQGYSGWGPHQLEGEIRDGQWWVVAASKDVIVEALAGTEGDKKAFWQEVLGLVGVQPTAENGA